MHQYDDYETSTRVCQCGASITWAGADSRLDVWMAEHSPHVKSKVALTTETTVDGARAYA